MVNLAISVGVRKVENASPLLGEIDRKINFSNVNFVLHDIILTIFPFLSRVNQYYQL
jgi:hypothetical protein